MLEQQNNIDKYIPPKPVKPPIERRSEYGKRYHEGFEEEESKVLITFLGMIYVFWRLLELISLPIWWPLYKIFYPIGLRMTEEEKEKTHVKS